jgi:hypothetical protein
MLSQVTTVVCAVLAGIEYVHWKHSTRPDALVEAKISLGACVIFVILFLVRLVYRVFLKKRDYFAEEMEHRSSLARSTFRAKS